MRYVLTGGRPHRAGLAGLITGMIVVLGLATAGTGTTSAKWKQPACGKAAKQVKKAKKQLRKARTGAQKSKARKAQKQAKGRLKFCKKNRKAYAVIKNGSYESVDDSGMVLRTVNETFCANGRWNDSYGWRNTGWKVSNTRFRSKRNFAAVVEGLIARKKMSDGTPYLQLYRIALVRKGNKWTRGTVSFTDLGTLSNERPVTRKAACR